MVPPWDPFATNYSDDPYPVFHQLRDHAPVHTTAGGVFALSRFRDVQDAARDWQVFSSAGPGGINLDDEASIAPQGNFINMDPPEHDILRKVLRRRLTPRDFRKLTPRIEALADAAAANLKDRHEADLSEEVAWQIPIRIICEMMGLPQSDAPSLNGLLEDFGHRVQGSDRMPPWGKEATESLRGYFLECIASRRRHKGPDLGDDVMTQLVVAQAEDPSLSDDHLVDLALLVLIAGTETSASMLSNAFFLLSSQPEIREQLTTGHASAEAVVDEVLRLESPVQFLARTTTRDVSLHDQTIPRGSRVALLFGAANRDERVFDAPDQFSLGRSQVHNLVFGDGLHRCMGFPLARLEGAVILPIVFSELKEYELLPGARRYPNPVVRGIRHLPIRF